MRNYQRKRDNPYILPTNLYRRILYLVKDYDRLKSEWENILYESPASPDGMPRSTGISDSTVDKVLRRDKIFTQMEAVDQGLMAIPDAYRRGVLGHVKYGERFPDYAHLNTWKTWQAKFLYQVARKLGEI